MYRCLVMGSERLPALSTICLFGCLARVWRFVICRLSFVICLNISLPFIQLLLFEQNTSVFYSFKFRNVLQHTEAGVEAPLLVITISKKKSPELEVLLCFKTKRNETKTDPPRKHPRNARVISAKELGAMSKNNLRRITLARGPIWGIHSLTLIISCPNQVPTIWNAASLTAELCYGITCPKV